MAQCFDLSGDQLGSNYAACSPDGEASQCCLVTDGCADNGLCVANDTSNTLTPYFIDGCTQQDFGPDTCLVECSESAFGNGVQPCGGDQYCCYGLDGCDCTDTFSLPALGNVIPPGAAVISSSTTPSSSSATTTSVPSGVATPLTVMSVSITTSAVPEASDLSDSALSSNGKDSNHNLGIGLGVGLGLGIPLIVAVGGILWFVKRRQKNGGYRGYSQGQTHVYQDQSNDSIISPMQEQAMPMTKMANTAPQLPPQELYARDGNDFPELLR